MVCEADDRRSLSLGDLPYDFVCQIAPEEHAIPLFANLNQLVFETVVFGAFHSGSPYWPQEAQFVEIIGQLVGDEPVILKHGEPIFPILPVSFRLRSRPNRPLQALSAC